MQRTMLGTQTEFPLFYFLEPNTYEDLKNLSPVYRSRDFRNKAENVTAREQALETDVAGA